MIYLIAPRIKMAEAAAYFLKLPRGGWRFVVRMQDIQGVRGEPGDLFVWVKAARYVLTLQEHEIEDYIAEYIKRSHIETLEYTLP